VALQVPADLVRAVADAVSARQSRASAVPTIVTPTTRPAPSVRSRATRDPSTIDALPVANARVSMVFWLPFLASTGHAKPTHMPHCSHARRPRYGVELIRSGTCTVEMPRASAAPASRSRAAPDGSGGIGRARERSPDHGPSTSPPLTPISHSARSYQGSSSSYPNGQSARALPSGTPYVDAIAKSRGPNRQAWAP